MKQAGMQQGWAFEWWNMKLGLLEQGRDKYEKKGEWEKEAG